VGPIDQSGGKPPFWKGKIARENGFAQQIDELADP
jgi:hypothetical protein